MTLWPYILKAQMFDIYKEFHLQLMLEYYFRE